MIRVLIAEDSLTAAELLTEILDAEPGIRVVGRAKNGREALKQTEELEPDLVTMDVHMPVLDGLEATKEIMARTPTPILIVTSSRTSPEGERGFAALRAGALGILEKPGNPTHPEFETRRRELVEMVKAMAEVKVVRRRPRTGSASSAPAPFRPTDPGAIRAVAIGASTGGPAALREILDGLPADFPAPILVVQHISPGFEQGLVEWLRTQTLLRVKTAEDGERTGPRTVYVAPDGRHLAVTPGGRIILEDEEALGGHRPSATRLFRTVARAFGRGAACVILSGMGRDGAEGLPAVKEAGGRVLAQDRDSSVVYGMPSEALKTGHVDEVLPPEGIRRRLTQWATTDET